MQLRCHADGHRNGMVLLAVMLRLEQIWMSWTNPELQGSVYPCMACHEPVQKNVLMEWSIHMMDMLQHQRTYHSIVFCFYP